MYLGGRGIKNSGGEVVDLLTIVVAFFFSLLMCLGLIIMKWIITQIGATIFSLILFLMIAMFLLSMGDQENDDE